jgi:hypothetical protein
MNKQRWLDIAEIIDAYRVVPRILLFGWMVFYMYYTWGLTEMFFAITAPTAGQSAFVTTVISALGTMSIWLGNIYITSRRAWGGKFGDAIKSNN